MWLAVVGAFILTLPALWNSTAYAAVTSIAAIGLYVAYVIPVFLRVLKGDRFERGPWHLGPLGQADRHRRVGLGGVHLRAVHAAHRRHRSSAGNFNYTPVAFLVVLGGAAIWWFVSARKWFTGPSVQGTPEELAAVERELEELG